MCMHSKASSHSSQLSRWQGAPVLGKPTGRCEPAFGFVRPDGHRHAGPERLVCAVVARKVTHRIKCVRGRNEPDLLQKAASVSPLWERPASHSSPSVTVTHSHTATRCVRVHSRSVLCSASLLEALRLLCMFGKWSSEVFPSPLIISPKPRGLGAAFDFVPAAYPGKSAVSHLCIHAHSGFYYSL